jgi:Chalcone isomerase-like
MNQMTRFGVLIAFCLLPMAHAAELNGVNMAETAKVGSTPLVLNGLGLRQKKILFNIDVYVAGLYVTKKSQDGQAIMTSPDPRRVELAFLRSVTNGQIRDAFDEAYRDNCESECAALKAPFDKLIAMMAPMKTGDRLAFDIFSTKVDVSLNGKAVGTVEDPKFPTALLKTWLGSHPPNEALKEGMLGLTH